MFTERDGGGKMNSTSEKKTFKRNKRHTRTGKSAKDSKATTNETPKPNKGKQTNTFSIER